MKFKNTNFYNGYKGYKGKEIDQTECELYDDIPAPDQTELLLQLLAGGQIAERNRRAHFYDTAEDIDPDDIDEIDAGSSAEEFDYISAYKAEVEKRKKYFQMRHPEAKVTPTKSEPESEPEQQKPKKDNDGVN